MFSRRRRQQKICPGISYCPCNRLSRYLHNSLSPSAVIWHYISWLIQSIYSYPQTIPIRKLPREWPKNLLMTSQNSGNSLPPDSFNPLRKPMFILVLKRNIWKKTNLPVANKCFEIIHMKFQSHRSRNYPSISSLIKFSKWRGMVL